MCQAEISHQCFLNYFGFNQLFDKCTIANPPVGLRYAPKLLIACCDGFLTLVIAYVPQTPPRLLFACLRSPRFPIWNQPINRKPSSLCSTTISVFPISQSREAKRVTSHYPSDGVQLTAHQAHIAHHKALNRTCVASLILCASPPERVACTPRQAKIL